MNETPSTDPSSLEGSRSSPDFFRILCWVAAAATVATLAWIVIEIVRQAWPAIKEFGFGFIVGTSWTPNRGVFGVLPFLIGTIVSSVIAILIALPLGLAVAIFLSEDFLPLPIRNTIRFVVELLAAIPSVVYGLWGIAVVIPLVQKYGAVLADFAAKDSGWVNETLGFTIPLFKGPSFGNSMLTASIVLALMILPTITAISRSALVAVPHTLREGAYALGATRWEAIFGVILPTAAPGIVAATILALGRAMGETMAIAMLIGNSARLTWSLLYPSGTLAALLANEFAEASGLQIASLMYAALLLVVLTLAVNVIGEIVLKRAQKNVAGAL
ncbi:MAG: phosphate ABC transporter permease subunit PstC [Chthoniobacterales bacterium]